MTRNIKEMDIVFPAKSEMQKSQALQDPGYFEAACIRACVHGYFCCKCQNVNKNKQYNVLYYILASVTSIFGNLLKCQILW